MWRWPVTQVDRNLGCLQQELQKSELWSKNWIQIEAHKARQEKKNKLRK
jgi:hypothetical protein